MNSHHIAVILVRPENPDNIGAAARAMKNMGFSDLRLVQPPLKWYARGKKMAMSAGDTLKQARLFRSVREAVRDLHLVFGTTRRKRGKGGAFSPFEKAVKTLQQASSGQKTGIVFGCESKGLANRDIAFCDGLITIPTARVYPSLNLAQAVMIVLFALSSGKNLSQFPKEIRNRFLTKKEIADTLAHFEKALKVLGYRKGGADLLPRILRTFRGLLHRGGLLEPEAQMIKGLSRRIRDQSCAPC